MYIDWSGPEKIRQTFVRERDGTPTSEDLRKAGTP